MQHKRGLVTLLFTIVFSLITPHEKKEGERLTLFSLWATKERGKDPNLSGRSYDKNNEVRDTASLIRHRKEHINQLKCASGYLN